MTFIKTLLEKVSKNMKRIIETSDYDLPLYENITLEIDNITELSSIECIPSLRPIIEHTIKTMTENDSRICRLWQFHHHKNESYFSMKITRSSGDLYPKVHIKIEDPDVAKTAIKENHFEIFTLDGVKNIFDKGKIKTLFVGPILPGEYLDEDGNWVDK